MSDSDFKIPGRSPSSGISEPQFFHNNLHYREVVATLRYGIEARKGLILFSGDPGTGKTTLIQRLMQDLDASVISIFESDAGVNFTDLLRSIMRHLHAGGDAPDPLSMVDSCKAVLRAQRDSGHITCLIIDNAQHLDDLTLEYLMETFFPADSGNRDNHLLQVVLAGRPPMREKLLHPWLRPLNPHLGLVCHVEPLNERDLAAYVEDLLGACQFPADLFDREATRRILDYTSGNPRLINELGLRAVQLAEASPSRRITPECIANAARDIGLSEAWRSRKTNNVTTALPNERKEPEESFDFEVSEANTTDMLMQTFLQDTPARRRRRFTGGGRWGTGVRVVVPLLLIVGIALWMPRDLVTSHLADWADGLKAISASPMFSSGEKPEAKSPPAPTETAKAPGVTPRAGSPSQQRDEAVINNTPPSQDEKSDELSFPAADNSTATESKPSVKPTRSPRNGNEQGSRAEPVEIRSKEIETQVQKAIQNRAISGVQVSVINGTAVLQGRVATQRQKQAAERAANSVDGVARVRNRIVVG
jgi:type II secretory pathway predicted ATPase ExeA